MGFSWFGVLRFVQNHSTSTILEEKKKRKKCSGIGYSSKEAFCKLGTRKPPGGVKATQGNEGQQLLWGLNVGVFASCMAPGSSGEDLGGRC